MAGQAFSSLLSFSFSATYRPRAIFPRLRSSVRFSVGVRLMVTLVALMRFGVGLRPGLFGLAGIKRKSARD